MLTILIKTSTALADTQLSARAQYQFFFTELDDSSPFAMATSDQLREHFADLRLMAEHSKDSLVFAAHYQLQAIDSDILQFINTQPALSTGELLRVAGIQQDRRRLIDLTHIMHNRDATAYLHRLDRFYIGQDTEHYSWRAGRFAVSWGNGLVFNPVDIFNPFDPVAIDKEYKTGDDMLYAQYLLGDSKDLQLIAVPRRNLSTGNVSTAQSSLAVKLHGLAGNTDYDVLIARHFDENMIAAGFASDIAGLLWRGDITYSMGDVDNASFLVTSLQYSWSWADRPVSGFVEYYFSDIGLHYNDGYDGAELLARPSLIERTARGEVFTIARRYLAPGLDIEIHPLVHFTLTMFWNIDDRSALLQLIFSYDMQQDMTIHAGFNLTSGERGSEYGETDPSQPVAGIGNGQTLFFRLSAYF